MPQYESEESAFNFAVDYLHSISNCLKMCIEMSANYNVDGWYRWLRSAFRCLACKTTYAEDEEFNKEFIKINELMNDNSLRNKNQILSKLDILEIKIRKKLQEKGMLLPSKSDPRFAVLER